jgi:diacylglycerol kinase (ATP)
MKRRRFAAIVNPISGRRSMSKVVERVSEIIGREGGSIDVLSTRHAGHATELAASLDDRYDGLLIVGGDGTVSETIQGLAGRSIPFSILPTGTENLLARELGQLRQAEEVAGRLLEGVVCPIDLATANGKRFAAVAGVGFDAECVERMSRKRAGHITHWSYVGPIWQTFWRHRFPRLRVEVDGVMVFEGRSLVILGVIGRYATNLRILRDARWDDGLIDVAVFPCGGRLRLLGHAVRVLRRTHVEHGGVVYRQCSRARVTSDDDVLIEVDGDVAGSLPLEVESLPSAGLIFQAPCDSRRS